MFNAIFQKDHNIRYKDCGVDILYIQIITTVFTRGQSDDKNKFERMQICWRKKIAFKDEETTTVTADKILIVGTTPRIPEIKGLKESRFITSDEALRLRQKPRIFTFIGGGYITCELLIFMALELKLISFK